MSRPVAIYARLSVTREESVSIDRQFESARQYAASQGWTVVLEKSDEGVSATHNKPQDRPGWQDLVNAPERFEGVVVWKVDRLARRVLDFLTADESLQLRGAGVVSATEPIDMTTPQGRAFATMLAVFAELEAAAISARVRGARDYLIRARRVVGGTVPYGWKSIKNPEGPGLVLAQDPVRIEWVRGMVERALRGDTLYSIMKWLDAEGAPLPEASQSNRKRDGWTYSTVERLLRNPVLAGMIPYQPGRKRHDAVDPTAVLRDESGMPVVDDSVAIMSPGERIDLLAVLDGRNTPQARPRASKGTTSPLLSGLVTCGHCSRTMHRGTTQGRSSLKCPACHQTISRRQLDPHIEERLISERGAFMLLKSEVHGESTDLAMIESAIEDLSHQFTQDGADEETLLAQIRALKADREVARHAKPRRTYRATGKTVAQAWHEAPTDDERHAVLASQVARLAIVRGKPGRYLDPARVELEWLPEGTIGPFNVAVQP